MVLKFWIFSILAFLGLGAFWRVVFFLFYAPPDLPVGTLLHAFWLGARFDLSIACYGFSVPLLLRFVLSLFEVGWAKASLIPEPWGRRGLVLWTGLWGALISFISVVDVGFYGFYQDRLNTLLFGFFEDDTLALIATIWKNYPVIWIFLGLVTLIAFQFWFIRDLAHRLVPTSITPSKRWSRRLAFSTGFFLLFLTNSLGARGSLGLFPLTEMDTHIASHPFVNLLAFNPVHAFGRAIGNKAQSRVRWNSNLIAFGYGDDATRAWSDCTSVPVESLPEDPRELIRRKTPANPWARETTPHVLVLVMESMGAHWLQYRQAPFDLVGALAPHLTPELSTTNFLASTMATVGSLSSLMAGVPHRPFSDFLTEGEHLATRVRTAPALTFKSQGYRTRFIYSGNPGWRDIGKYALIQGFDVVEGDTEISAKLGKNLPRHDWGLFDEDLWDYVEQTLAEASEPQFLLIMTTANHPPYTLPPGQAPYDLKIPDEILQRKVGETRMLEQRFQTFRHSNEKLGGFLDRLDQTVWGRRSLVAITGDHSFWVVSFSEKELMAKHAVPLILKLPPGLNAQFPSGTFGAHDQIWPTLYNLALDEADYHTFSSDLLDPLAPRQGLNYSSLIVGPDGGVLVGAGPTGDSAFIWNNGAAEPGEMTDAKQNMARHYRCTMSVLDDFFRREREDRPLRPQER